MTACKNFEATRAAQSEGGQDHVGEGTPSDVSRENRQKPAVRDMATRRGGSRTCLVGPSAFLSERGNNYPLLGLF